MSVLISSADARRLQQAQRALLSVSPLTSSFPDAFSSSPSASGLALTTTEAWVDNVARAVRPLFNSDQVYYTEPLDPTEPPERSAEADPNSDPDAGSRGRLFACNPSAGEDFSRGLCRHFKGFQNGYSRFREARPTMVRRLVRSAGAGAFHDAPLYDAAAQRASPMHQEVFRPEGIERKLALSVPLPAGEAMLVIGFAASKAPAFRGKRHRLLELLLPAFEAGLRVRRHVARKLSIPTAAAGEAPVPMVFFDEEGRERFRNSAFGRLVRPFAASPAERGHVELLEASRTLADRSRTPEPSSALGAITSTVGPYRLRACAGVVHRGAAGVLVFVERGQLGHETGAGASPAGELSKPVPPEPALPAAADIAASTHLTVREAQAARFIAEGCTDREVAAHLQISVYTARRHAGRVLSKLGLSSRAGVGLALLRACAF
jgi:DNA-binding CsgD family transcriptional regulator